MATETITVYGVRSTQLRHGKRTVVVDTAPGHETDRHWHENLAEAERQWQESVGLTPDAHLVARTVTTSDWYGI
jgi:hypothetical protein